MATLHVRNVPDALYESLRERSAQNGRSIGAETVVVLEGELGAGSGTVSEGARRFPRRRGGALFQRFSTRARQVIVDAQDGARELGSPVLGTEHLLLALLEEPPTVASDTLGNAGLDVAGIRAAIEAVPLAPGRVPAANQGIAFTPGAKKALELALRESIGMRCTAIAPEHLLLGIAREEKGLGAKILATAGQDVEGIRRIVLVPRLPAPERPLGFRVVELTGEAGDWEHQLNGFAADGHELVDIVERRAIFRVEAFGD